MNKMIEVKDCVNCPYNKKTFLDNKPIWYCDSLSNCPTIEIGKILIPDWCPLPDAKEAEDEN